MWPGDTPSPAPPLPPPLLLQFLEHFVVCSTSGLLHRCSLLEQPSTTSSQGEVCSSPQETEAPFFPEISRGIPLPSELGVFLTHHSESAFKSQLD